MNKYLWVKRKKCELFVGNYDNVLNIFRYSFLGLSVSN